MQDDHDNPAKSITRTRLARTRFVGMKPAQGIIDPLPTTDNLSMDHAGASADQPTTTTRPQLQAVREAVSAHLPAAFRRGNPPAPVENQEIAHLLQLSGMMRPVHASTRPLAETDEDGYWPLGIQQVGPLPIKNLYGREPFGRTFPQAVPLVMPGSGEQTQTLWQRVLRAPAWSISLGLLIGLGLLFLASRFVDLSRAMSILGTHLGTARGIALALLAGVAFLAGRAIRGLRWKLALNSSGKVSALTVVELYQSATLLNFLLPIHAGEAAKSLDLKRLASVPISKSLPVVATDKALDFLPPLVIIPLVPLLGISMNLQLWLVFALGSAILLSLALFTGLVIRERAFATGLLQQILRPLPGTISGKIESVITGFVAALQAGARRPALFLLAILLTCVAVACDTLFILLAFWTIGLPLAFGAALFGIAVCGIFSILPMPPGQLGSAELVGLLVFSGLLRLPGDSVAALYIFFHPWIALVLVASGMGCVAALGLKVSNVLHMWSEH